MNKDIQFLEQAIELAMANKGHGGRPFGAVLVKNGQVIATGTNNMLANFDPSSHAEMEAIRKAATSAKNIDLSGSTIYASGQPCPMCLAVIAITNISEIFFAFDNNDAAPFNFASTSLYNKLKISDVNFVPMKKLKTKYTAAELYSS
jgi:Cytosine/adenosine deaminases